MTDASPTADWRPSALAGTFGTGVLAGAGLGAILLAPRWRRFAGAAEQPGVPSRPDAGP